MSVVVVVVAVNVVIVVVVVVNVETEVVCVVDDDGVVVVVVVGPTAFQDTVVFPLQLCCRYRRSISVVCGRWALLWKT